MTDRTGYSHTQQRRYTSAMRARQPLIAVAAARSIAAHLARPEAQKHAALCLFDTGASLAGKEALCDALCGHLRDTARNGGTARICELMGTVADACANVKSAPSGENPEAHIAAELAVSALVGVAMSGEAAVEAATKGKSGTDSCWLARLERRPSFWAAFSAATGRSALLPALEQLVQGNVPLPGAGAAWSILWNAAHSSSATMESDEVCFALFALRAAHILKGAAADRALAAAAQLVHSQRELGVASATRILAAACATGSKPGERVSSAAIALLCRCLEQNDMRVLRDVLAVVARCGPPKHEGQRHVLVLLCAFVLVVSAGALADDAVPALEACAPLAECHYTARLVRCALITTLHTNNTHRRAKQLLARLEQQPQKAQSVCPCQRDDNKPWQQEPLSLAIRSFARSLCAVDRRSPEDYTNWLRGLQHAVADLKACQNMLLFFLMPIVMPDRAPQCVSAAVSVVRALAGSCPRDTFALFPLCLNMLASQSLAPADTVSLLGAITQLAQEPLAVPELLGVLKPLAKKRELQPTAIRCFALLWKHNSNAFPFLVKVLQCACTRDMDAATQLAAAHAVLDVCSTSINRGRELAHIAAHLLETSHEPLVLHMTLSALALLCEAEELAYAPLWNTLHTRFGGPDAPPLVTAAMLKVAQCAAAFEDAQELEPDEVSTARADEAKQIVQTALGFISANMEHESEHVRAAAVAALNEFSLESVQQCATEDVLARLLEDPSDEVGAKATELIGRLCSEETAPRATTTTAAATQPKAAVLLGEQAKKHPTPQETNHPLVKQVQHLQAHIAGLDEETAAATGSYPAVLCAMATRQLCEGRVPDSEARALLLAALNHMEGASTWPQLVVVLSSFARFFAAQHAVGFLISGDGTEGMQWLVQQLIVLRGVSPAKAQLCLVAGGALVLALQPERRYLAQLVKPLLRGSAAPSDPLAASGAVLCSACLAVAESPLAHISGVLKSNAVALGKDFATPEQGAATLLATCLLAEQAARHVASATLLRPAKKDAADAAMACFNALAERPTHSFEQAATLGVLAHALSQLGEPEPLAKVEYLASEALEQRTNGKPCDLGVVCAAVPAVARKFELAMKRKDADKAARTELDTFVSALVDVVNDTKTSPRDAAGAAVALGSLAHFCVLHNTGTNAQTITAASDAIEALTTRDTSDSNALEAAYAASANLVGANAFTSSTGSLGLLSADHLCVASSAEAATTALCKMLASTEDAQRDTSNVRRARAASLGCALLCRPCELAQSAASSAATKAAKTEAATAFRSMPRCGQCFEALVEAGSLTPEQRARTAARCLACLSRCAILPALNWSRVLGTALQQCSHSPAVAEACARFCQSRFAVCGAVGAGLLCQKVATSCVSFMGELATPQQLALVRATAPGACAPTGAVCEALAAMRSAAPRDFGALCLEYVRAVPADSVADDDCQLLNTIAEQAAAGGKSDEPFSAEYRGTLADALNTLLGKLPSPLVSRGPPSAAASMSFSPQALVVIDAVARALFTVARGAPEGRQHEHFALAMSQHLSKQTSDAVARVCAALTSGVRCGALGLASMALLRDWCATTDPVDAPRHVLAVLCADHVARSLCCCDKPSVQREQWLVNCAETLLFHQRKRGAVPLAAAALLDHALVRERSFGLLVEMCARAEQHRLLVGASVGSGCSVGLLPVLPLELRVFLGGHKAPAARKLLAELATAPQPLSSLFAWAC